MDMRQRMGPAVPCAGVSYMVIFGSIAGWWFAATARHQTCEAIQETVWSFEKPLLGSDAFSVPDGAILVAIGVLLPAGVKALRIGVFDVGVIDRGLSDSYYLLISISVQARGAKTHESDQAVIRRGR